VSLRYKAKHWPRLFRRWIGRKMFQLRHGFDYADTWCLFYAQAKWLLPRLRHFKEFTGGHPFDITQEKWVEIIEQMIRAFELSIMEGDGDILTEDEYVEVDRGLHLLAEWYFHLWN